MSQSRFPAWASPGARGTSSRRGPMCSKRSRSSAAIARWSPAISRPTNCSAASTGTLAPMTRSPPISPPTSATRCSRAMPTASTGSAWTFKRMRVVDLRAEHVIGLLGTEEARPRLSWRIESDARGAVQTHYRIRAAASPEALAADDLLWDSGRVASGALLDIAWDGPALAAMQRVWWDVEVNDAARRSEEHTSELQSLMRISYAVFCLTNKRKPT